MKAGVHDGEAWESIVRRKLKEERDYGVAYWGTAEPSAIR